MNHGKQAAAMYERREGRKKINKEKKFHLRLDSGVDKCRSAVFYVNYSFS